MIYSRLLQATHCTETSRGRGGGSPLPLVAGVELSGPPRGPDGDQGVWAAALGR